jgi:hypothetical protein
MFNFYAICLCGSRHPSLLGAKTLKQNKMGREARTLDFRISLSYEAFAPANIEIPTGVNLRVSQLRNRPFSPTAVR